MNEVKAFYNGGYIFIYIYIHILFQLRIRIFLNNLFKKLYSFARTRAQFTISLAFVQILIFIITKPKDYT